MADEPDAALFAAVREAMARDDPDDGEFDAASTRQVAEILRAIEIAATTPRGLSAKALLAHRFERSDIVLPVMTSIARDAVAIVETLLGFPTAPRGR